jgi:lipopolysaccharide export system permease protein
VFRLLQRSIFWELVKVFVPSLIAITGLIVLATIIKESSDHGLSPSQMLVAVCLIVPSMMPFIIPPTTLFAACVVYGRLAHDNEITAIKSAGISVLHTIWPGAVLGMVMSGMLFGMYYYLIPYSQHILRTAFINDAEEFILAVLKRDHEIRGMDRKLNWEIWVEQIHGRQLRNAIFKHRDASGKHYDVIARSREAELHVDAVKREVLVQMRHGEVLDDGGKTRVHFEEKDYSVPLPEFDKNRPTPREMTWNELLSNRAEAAARLDNALSGLLDIDGKQLPPGLPREQAQAYLRHVQVVQQQFLRSLEVELQMRPALACGCFFFVLVGCPVGIWFSRSDYLSAFISCFLPIVFIYYPVSLCCTNLGKDGKIAPFTSQWAANAILAVIAFILFRKLVKN